MKTLLILLASLSSSVFSQQIIALNTIEPGVSPLISDKSILSVYVSASSDDADVLKDIVFQSANTTSKRAIDLRDSKYLVTSDQKVAWIIQGPIYTQTTADKASLKKLKGLLYVRPTLPTDNNFYVYDVTQSNTVTATADATVVVFNTNTDASTSVKNWQQTSDQTAILYEGFPEVDGSKTYQMLANPINVSPIGSKFYSTVESFSVNVPVFYGLFTKGIKFVIGKGAVSQSNSVTTAATTTGLVAKSESEASSTKSIAFKSNQGTSGWSGFSSISKKLNGSVTVTLSYSDGDVPTTLDYINSIGKNALASKVVITSTDTSAYYVQYFRIEDSTNPTINPLRTTVNPLRTTAQRTDTTTTGSSSIHQVISCFLVMIIGLF